MLRIGLTGGIGSGKSTVAKVFSALGVPVFYADNEAKKFLSRPNIIQELAHQFGNTILTADGQINKANLANVVFNDPAALVFLNNAIHPPLLQQFDTWVAQQSQLAFPYCIIEAAILFEAHFNTHVDKVIVVSAPKYERVERVLRRDQISYEQVVARMKNQWEEPQLLAQADFVVKNPNHEMMLPQIIKIHHALQA